MIEKTGNQIVISCREQIRDVQAFYLVYAVILKKENRWTQN